MRLPLPPARISPVTEDCTARSPLRHHRRRDGLPEAVLAGKEQVVFSARRAADHGDPDLVGDLVAHLGEARAGNEERDAHLRCLDHHFQYVCRRADDMRAAVQISEMQKPNNCRRPTFFCRQYFFYTVVICYRHTISIFDFPYRRAYALPAIWCEFPCRA